MICDRCGCERTAERCENCEALEAVAILAEESMDAAFTAGKHVTCRYDPHVVRLDGVPVVDPKTCGMTVAATLLREAVMALSESHNTLVPDAAPETMERWEIKRAVKAIEKVQLAGGLDKVLEDAAKPPDLSLSKLELQKLNAVAGDVVVLSGLPDDAYHSVIHRDKLHHFLEEALGKGVGLLILHTGQTVETQTLLAEIDRLRAALTEQREWCAKIVTAPHALTEKGGTITAKGVAVILADKARAIRGG